MPGSSRLLGSCSSPSRLISFTMVLSVSLLCTMCSTGPWTVICRETNVSSTTVRDILPHLASCWIQGTVHSYMELSGIQHCTVQCTDMIKMLRDKKNHDTKNNFYFLNWDGFPYLSKFKNSLFSNNKYPFVLIN